MMKVVMLLVGLLNIGSLVAQENPLSEISHVVTLAGVPEGEGRFIRVDLTKNGQFQMGYYFCAAAGKDVYGDYYSYSPSSEPFHIEHSLKFSICQDESLVHCQEFATDKYTTSRNKEGQLENDVSEATVDVSALTNAFQTCEPVLDMDDLVKQSIHANDRRFSRIG